MAHLGIPFIVHGENEKVASNVHLQKEDLYQVREGNHYGMDVPIEAKIEDVAKTIMVKAALEKSIEAAVNHIGTTREDEVRIKESEV